MAIKPTKKVVPAKAKLIRAPRKRATRQVGPQAAPPLAPPPRIPGQLPDWSECALSSAAAVPIVPVPIVRREPHKSWLSKFWDWFTS